MNCPKCKTVSLRKRGYDSPFHCHKCGGIWVEKQRIPQFVENAHSTEHSRDQHNLHDDITGLCPSGHGILIRAKIAVEPPFYLEKCTTCGGIWLDNGEWERIVSNNLVEHLQDFWCRSWQAKQRKEKNRESFLQSNQTLLGDSVFMEVMKLAESLKEHPEKRRAIALLQQEVLQ